MYEEYPCDTELELRQRETHWIKQLIKDKNCINERIPYRTFEETWKNRQLFYNKN